MDEMKLLEGVHPDLVKAIVEIKAEMAALGRPMRVTQGVRTAEEQNHLYQLGRTLPGQIVTYRDGYKLKSNHQPHDDGYGWAVDCCFLGRDPYLNGDPAGHKWWAKYGELVVKRGLKWGGNFPSFDGPHAELP